MKPLEKLIKDLNGEFDERSLKYMKVHKAMFYVQLEDLETKEVHLHKVNFKAKDCVNLLARGDFFYDERNL